MKLNSAISKYLPIIQIPFTVDLCAGSDDIEWNSAKNGDQQTETY